MAFDPIILCLSELTDYREFERFCCALLGPLYPTMQPLGGSNDGGRDAVIRSNDQGGMTAFAYSVRDDWQRKLMLDARRARITNPSVNQVVFATTARLSATQKDQAIERVRNDIAATLDLFDVEHLRQLLLARPYLIQHHPAIFRPELFPPAAAPAFVPEYIRKHHSLFSTLLRCNEDLANQVETELFNELGWFAANTEADKLLCPEGPTLALLVPVQLAVSHVFCILSDEFYTLVSWGRKFDNRERRDFDVQAVLRKKREGMSEALQNFRAALAALKAHAGTPA